MTKVDCLHWIKCIILLNVLCMIGCSYDSSDNGLFPHPISSIDIIPSQETIKIGERLTFQLYAQLINQQTVVITENIHWSSDDQSIASINDQGEAQGISIGEANIIANFQNYKATAKITVIDSQPDTITLSIMPNNAQLHLGESKQYKALGRYPDQHVEDLTGSVQWTSESANIATVTATGKVEAKQEGLAEISAALTNQPAKATTKVVVVDARLEQIILKPNLVTLHCGEEKEIMGCGRFSDQTVVDISDQIQWSINDDTIASMPSHGVIQGEAKGSTDAIGTAQGKSAVVTIHVKDATLKDIQITPPNKTTHLGLTQQFFAIGSYSDGDQAPLNKGIKWIAEPVDIVSMDGHGLAKTMGTGIATITATDEKSGVTGTTRLNINSKAIEHFVIQPDKTTLHPGMIKRLHAMITYTDGSNEDASLDAQWASEQPDVIDVMPNGQIQAKSIGSSQINATFDNKKAIASVQVTNKVLKQLHISPIDAIMPLGVNADYTLTGYYSDDSFENLTLTADWKTRDASIASIDNQGKLTTQSKGTTEVNASFDTLTSQTTVQVTDALLSTLQISPLGSQKDFIVGEKSRLLALGLFTDGELMDISQQVIWTSHSPDVLSIIPEGEQGGQVTAHAQGQAVIQIIHPETQKKNSETYRVNQVTLDKIALSPTNPQTPAHNDIDFTAMGTFSDGKSRDITQDAFWFSSDDAIAETVNKGQFITKTPGDVIISASLLNTQAETTLSVIDPSQVKEIIISPNPVKTSPFKTIVFTSKAIFMDGRELDVTRHGDWQSSDWLIAMILEIWPWHGRTWTAGKKGHCEISHMYKGVKGTASLTVE